MDRFAKKYVMYLKYEPYDEPVKIKNLMFWVGMKNDIFDHRPVRRQLADSFSPRDVYKHNNILLFECGNQYYYIPECEKCAIQKRTL